MGESLRDGTSLTVLSLHAARANLEIRPYDPVAGIGILRASAGSSFYNSLCR